jgi:alpha-1,6-mannosyltransferase
MAGSLERARDVASRSPDLQRWARRGRELLYGPPPGSSPSSEVSAWQPPPSAAPRLWVTVLAALSGFLGGLLIAASAPVWRLAEQVAPTWRLTLPGVPHPGTTTESTLWFLAGLLLLAAGWLGLVHRAGRPGPARARIVMVAAVIALWAIPVSLGPPLLSNDVYSYVAQGEMASRGVDPSSIGPVGIGRNDWTTIADPVWRSSPAPYGPVAVATSWGVVGLAGHDPATSVWIYRGVVTIGVIMAGVGIVLIAARSRVNPAVALAIGLANPVVILHLLGGVHNDALMFGLLALGLAAAQRDRKKLALALLAAATAVKLPAAIGLVYLGWTWSGAVAPLRRRVATTAAVVGVAAVGIALASVAVGLGPGWLTALKSTGKVNDTYSPTTKIGFSISELLGAVGIQADGAVLAGGVRLVGLALTAVLAVVMMLRSPRVGIVRATGVMLVAYVLLGPVIWPWYLPAGFALLAATGLGRYRPAYLIVCIAVSWFVWPTSVMSLEGLGGGYQHLRGLGVVLLVCGLAWGAQRFATRWERRHRRALGSTEAAAFDAGRRLEATSA